MTGDRNQPIRDRILEHLFHAQVEWVQQARYPDLFDVSRQAVSQAITELKEDGLIEVEQQGRGNVVRLSSDGWLHMKRSGGHVSTVLDNDDRQYIRLHNVVVHIPVAAGLGELERWMKKDLSRVRGDGGDGLVGDWGDGYVRATHEGLFIQLDEVVADSVSKAKGEAVVRAFELVSWFEDDVGVDVDRSPAWIEVEVSEEHVASVADAFCQWCEDNGVDEFKVKSREGDFYEYKLDRSTGELELECEKRNRAESNIREFKRFMQGLADGSIEVGDLESVDEAIEVLAENQAMLTGMMRSMIEDDKSGRDGARDEIRTGKHGDDENEYYDGEMEKALGRMEKWAARNGESDV